jgi:hypothetical protein
MESLVADQQDDQWTDFVGVFQRDGGVARLQGDRTGTWPVVDEGRLQEIILARWTVPASNGRRACADIGGLG